MKQQNFKEVQIVNEKLQNMKLKEFNTDNTVSFRAGVPAIGVNTKTGLFNMNKLAVKLMELNDNDQVVLLQDEQEPENWYMEKVKKGGFVVRSKTNVGTGLVFNNTTLARSLFEGIGGNGGGVSLRILIAGKPTVLDKRKLWGLLPKPQKP